MEKDNPLYPIPGIGQEAVETANAEYITEMPAKKCMKCGRTASPVIKRNTKIDPKHGYTFVCPLCGHHYGQGGKNKPLVDAEGKRILSSNWSVARLGRTFCQICGVSQIMAEALGMQLEVHHIIPVSQGGKDDLYNLIVLCSWCHREAHKRLDFWAQNKKGLIHRLYKEFDPGKNSWDYGSNLEQGELNLGHKTNAG